MPMVCGDRDEIHSMARKEGRSMQARRLRGPRAWDGRTKFDSPRQISRDERVDLTLATMELEGLELC